MRKASVRELDIRGTPVDELRPVPGVAGTPAADKARIFLEMREVWDRTPVTGDSTKAINEDRNR